MSGEVQVVWAMYGGMPLSGLVDVDGALHLFDREYLADAKDWGELYNVWPAPDELVQHMLGERDRIRAWLAAGKPQQPRNDLPPPYNADPGVVASAAIEKIRDGLAAPRKLRLTFIRPEVETEAHDGWRVTLGEP